MKKDNATDNRQNNEYKRIKRDGYSSISPESMREIEEAIKRMFQNIFK